MDGARVAAAAVTWLCAQPLAADMESGIPQGPEALLDHLRTVAQTEDMREKLDLIRQKLFQVRMGMQGLRKCDQRILT